jgi:hypothetical protein
VENFLCLRQLAPDLPFIPVVQGWYASDYLRCMDMYSAAGVELAGEPLVGLGSVCRRQGTADIEAIVRTLCGVGLRLHGFGVKVDGLRHYGGQLASADSMAWSFRGRYVRGCSHRGRHQQAVISEANCLHFASQWRRHLFRNSRLPSTLNGETHA